MMSPLFVTSVLLFVFTYPCSGLFGEDHCESSSECGPGDCCTIGPMRYSIPQCRAFQGEGDICRPSGVVTFNTTVGYPNGVEIKLTDVYYILCPCAAGLTCHPKEGVCKDLGEKPNRNVLLVENNMTED